MQQSNLYIMYDTEAGATSGPIFHERAHGAAIRSFNDVLGRKDTLPGQYPQHFSLLHVGEIDLETGHITTHTAYTPNTIATGTQWLEANRPQLQLSREAQ